MNANQMFSARMGMSLTDPDAIEANRQGRITENQRTALQASIFDFLGCGSIAGWAIGLPIVAFILILALVSADAPYWIAIPAVGVLVLVWGVLILVNVLGFFQKQAAINNDLKENRVARGEGEVIYRKRKYVALVDGKTLRLPPQRGGVAPGVRYRFYYLPRGLVALSAETAAPIGEQQAESQAQLGLTRALAMALGYEMDALNENRMGRLAGSQAGKLIPGLLGGGLMVLIAAGLAAFLGFSLMQGTARMESGMIITLLIFGGFTAFIGIWGAVKVSQGLRDLLRREVETIEGIGTKKTVTHRSRRGSSTSYYYVIGEKQFSVSHDAFYALFDNLRYKAYYTPATGRLVALEPLDAPDLDVK